MISLSSPGQSRSRDLAAWPFHATTSRTLSWQSVRSSSSKCIGKTNGMQTFLAPVPGQSSMHANHSEVLVLSMTMLRRSSRDRPLGVTYSAGGRSKSICHA